MQGLRRKLRNGFVATVAAGVMVLGLGSGAAQAAAIAYSFLEVTNFQIFDAGSNQYDVSDFTFISIGNNTTASATLNAGSTSGSDGPQPGDSDVPMQCVGDCVGVGQLLLTDQNDFAETIPLGTKFFSRGDAELTGAAITDTVNGVVTNSATATHVAETQLLGSATGDASGEVTSTSGFVFTLAAAGTITIEFDATAFLRAQLSAELQAGSLAEADLDWNIEIAEVDPNTGIVTTIFSWSPDGIAGGIIGGTENNDPFSLSQSRATVFPGSLALYNPGTGFFSATTLLLSDGVQYIFSINHDGNTDATSIVPEPASIGLLGFGLIGLGLLRRRRRARA